MGLQSSFDTNRDHLNTGAGTGKLIVDLSAFKIGGTPIGKEPWDGDFFATSLSQDGVFEQESAGYELTSNDAVLKSAFITLENFQGIFLIQDQVSPLSTQITKEKILTLFGAPYWTDLDDGEIIFFYEYQGGSIELQFEFPDGQHLGFITLMQNGVLSDAEQRKIYGVTKPWPTE
ncbi:MAG: hypothetical protein ACJAT6_000983 [Akkermansiaceae bacterium]|jgi:hypothetical protein|tara:strand:+ start:74 stop:598 length:525 start_codon:yes stop_codon:yes gene_type:complete